MIGDKSFLSPNIFITNLIFSDGIFRHQMYFFFSNFKRLCDEVLHHRLFWFFVFFVFVFVFVFVFFLNFNRLGDELFHHQFLLIVKYGNENYRHQIFFLLISNLYP